MDKELAYLIAEQTVILINDIIKDVIIKDRNVYTDSFFINQAVKPRHLWRGYKA